MTFHTDAYASFGRGGLDPVLIFLASYLVFAIPAALVALWFTGRAAKLDAVRAFVVVVASLAISYGLGMFFSHPAPYQLQTNTLLSASPENAFPSQHATVCFGMVWPLYALGRKRLSVVFLFVAILVSVGRVATGLHYPVDVVGSLLASLLGFGLVWLASEPVTVLSNRVIDLEARMRKSLIETFR